jgi:hypothetical protein
LTSRARTCVDPRGKVFEAKGESVRGKHWAVAAAAIATTAVAPVGATADPGEAAPSVAAVSTRAEYVTGGDVLVRVAVHDEGAAKHLRIERNGTDVTSSFQQMADGSLLGLVGGLAVGENEITARANGQGRGLPPGRGTTLHVVNHSKNGPLFSGPQQLPFFCETQAFGLGPAQDAWCNAPTQVSYRYRTTGGTFATLADPTTRPADLAQTTVNGRTVDYIVRLERGTIDRAVYELAALYDPAAPPSPFRAEPGWNDRLVYTYGGGCNVGYHQGASTGGVLNDLFLSRGYAVASSSLNVLDNNCSDVISAEVTLMVKEHFIETYGIPAHTIGWGGSGGAIQQHMIGNNYPGILDGIVPAISFTEALGLQTVGDCRLFFTFFANPANAAGWTAAQRNAATGYGTYNSCVNWHLAFASRLNAEEACPSAVPPAFRYTPANPTGIKCTSVEQVATQLGRNPANGFAWNPGDNVGVQYGLHAVNAGVITPEQFVRLNEAIGGYNFAGVVVAQRTTADPIGLRRGYETGRIADGSMGLAETPILDIRTYTDLLADIHTRVWSFTMRERLQKANGTTGNHVMFVANNAGSAAMNVEALARMDQWLTAIGMDGAAGSRAEKVLRNRPAGLGDTCWNGATRIEEAFSYQLAGQCETLFPTFAETRMAAGAPLANDTFKCALKPLDFAGYAVTFTPAQQARLTAAFPSGVCDWSRLGPEQRAPLGTWIDYR